MIGAINEKTIKILFFRIAAIEKYIKLKKL